MIGWMPYDQDIQEVLLDGWDRDDERPPIGSWVYVEDPTNEYRDRGVGRVDQHGPDWFSVLFNDDTTTWIGVDETWDFENE